MPDVKSYAVSGRAMKMMYHLPVGQTTGEHGTRFTLFRLCRLLGGCLLGLSLQSAPAQANECFPAIDSSQPQYIVGYGNLLYAPSRRARQLQSDPEVPVQLHGFTRGWLTRTRPENVKMTRLGVKADDQGHFNGVLIPMKAGKVKAIDREQKLHCRVPVARSQLQFLAAYGLQEGGQFWVYQTRKKHTHKPAGDYPMMMSEVDEFLTGCLQQAERFKLKSFAQECVSTTQNWSVHWVNDRQRPMTRKPVEVKKQQVDRLLETLEGNLYGRIRAE